MRRLLGAAAVTLFATCGAAAQVRIDETSWTNLKDQTQVPAYVFHDPGKARDDGTLPAVLFVHARRGIQAADKA
jgi:hypothetical protein